LKSTDFSLPSIDKHNIEIPNDFGLGVLLDETQDKWLINLSNTEVLYNVHTILQLGECFGLPLTKQRKDLP